MRAKPSAVINSSPLIALVACLPDFDALGGIVERLIIPGEVLAELAAGGHRDATAARVSAAPWCEVRDPLPPQASPLVVSLGRGEAAVIQTALNDRIRLVVIDEVRGRRAARLGGLTVIGSLGLLVELHRAGLLPSVGEAIQAMRQKGIHLAQHLIELTLRAAANAQAGDTHG